MPKIKYTLFMVPALVAGILLGPPIELETDAPEIAVASASESTPEPQAVPTPKKVVSKAEFKRPKPKIISEPPPVESTPVEVVADEVEPTVAPAPIVREEPEPEPVQEVVPEVVQEPEVVAPEPEVIEEPVVEEVVEEPVVEEAPVASGGNAGIAATALAYQGVPYVWGGDSPAGWDCSGFIQFVYAQHGVSLPHNTTAIRTSGKFVPTSNPQPGDLVYQNGGSHAGIYIGNGKMVGAQNPSVGTVIRDADSPYGPLMGYYTLAA